MSSAGREADGPNGDFDFESSFAVWDEDLSQSMAVDGDNSQHDHEAATASITAKKKRGRPKGSTGSAFIRQHVRELVAQAPIGPIGPIAQDSQDHRPGNLQQHHCEQQRLLKMFGPQTFLLNMGSPFQRVVSQALMSSVKSLVQTKENQELLKRLGEPSSKSTGALSHIVQGRALQCSAAALAAMDSTASKSDSEKARAPSTLQRLVVSVGALALECSALLSTCAMSSFIETCRRTAWGAVRMRPLMYFWRVRYDETPSKVRVVNVGSATSDLDPCQIQKCFNLVLQYPYTLGLGLV